MSRCNSAGMRAKKKVYSIDFKAKIVLKVLDGEQTLNEIASQYKILSKNLQNSF
jgi:transposase-like protein